ncbi:MAG: pseudouridine synthase [Candidatus Latescibacteria bacterium]|nr:pseudouridine synthase [Candidatus Latescibacterota bacterium]
MRLNRFLARAGIASRRRSDLLIEQGVVAVNGTVVRKPGCTLVVGRDKVALRGQPVLLPETGEYVLLHKTADSLVTRSDTHGRPTVFDQVDDIQAATVAVGRLDLDTTGALLLTDDGDLAHRLMHPRYEVVKRYTVVVWGRPAAEQLDRLRQGIELDDGKTAPAQVRLLETQRKGRHCRSLVELCLHEGRKRQVKRMFQAIGHQVAALERSEFAGLTLTGLPLGRWRRLSPGEIRRLHTLVGLPPK